MSAYYYIEDPESEFGYTPVAEDDYLMVILRVARKHGLRISSKMIFKELVEMHKKEKKNA